MKKYMRKAVVLVKLQPTAGVDAAPTGAANAMLVKDFDLTPLDGDEVEHERIQPHFGAFESELATAWSRVKFNVYLSGSGTAGTAPNFDPLLQACAASATIVPATSVTYAPATNLLKMATVYVNIDGVNCVLLDARGEVTGTTDAKGLPMLAFDMQGLFLALTDTPLPVPVYAAYARAVPVNRANTALTLHGLVVAASNFGFAFGNQVVYDHNTESESILITDRKSTYSATFEAVDIATKDWYGLAKAGTSGALQLVHGTVAGNIVTLSGARANVKKPAITNTNGIQYTGVTGNLIPSVSGNDEWSLAFT